MGLTDPCYCGRPSTWSYAMSTCRAAIFICEVHAAVWRGFRGSLAGVLARTGDPPGTAIGGPMIVIVYVTDGGDGYAHCAAPAPELPAGSFNREPGDVPAYSIRGADWDECMAHYHAIEGRGKYVPMAGA